MPFWHLGAKILLFICQNGTMPKWHKIKTVIDKMALCQNGIKLKL
jgi:hypothetical protein